MNISKKTRLTLAKLLQLYKEVVTDKGLLITEGEMNVNDEVFIEDETNNIVPATDGEYISENTKYTVENGIITAIEVEQEEEPIVEEPVVEEVETEEVEEVEEVEEEEETIVEETNEEVEALRKENEDLKAENESLKARIKDLEAELEKPIEEPIEEDFSKVEEVKEENKYLAMFKRAKEINNNNK